MGIANNVAGALGSLIFGVILLSGIDVIKNKLNVVNEAEKTLLLDIMADSVVILYVGMAVILAVLGI